jgi:DNA invertase Pin-like site-specific DNA recombinase
MTASHRIPAAQYLRMSTEHQQYSLENQSVAIKTYADAHGFEVVATYSDAARSGIVLKNRSGLRQLLKDTVSGAAQYRAILVYDVSRWGRFQDTDESAHYEFLCKSAGIPVHYCAEIFANDGSLPSLIMKALKRTMAGEYSRELGVKTSIGMRRLAALGFKQGGPAGYGLRRVLLSSTGEKRQTLAPGERKSLTTDRVILVPGPPEEVQVVRDIYRMFVLEKKSSHTIAAQLTRKGVPNPSMSGVNWNGSTVQNIVRHPRYAGFNVFGQTSCRLHTPRVHLPRSEWVVAPNAFEPIIDRSMFEKVQQRFAHLTINLSDAELLEGLRALLKKHGRLNTTIITNSPEAASVTGYVKRFGSLVRAFELAGHGRSDQFGDDETRSRTKALRRELLAQIEANFQSEVSIVWPDRRFRAHIRLRDGLVVAVVIVRSARRADKSLCWEIRSSHHQLGSLMLLARLDETNRSFLDFHLTRNIKPKQWFRISLRDSWLKKGKRLRDISQFCDAAKAVVSRASGQTRRSRTSA